MAAVGLAAPLGCTLLIDSEGLTDRFGEAQTDSATADSTAVEVEIDTAVEETAALDTADTNEVAVDTRPPDPPDTSACISQTAGGKTYLVCDSFGNWNKGRTVCASFGDYTLVAIDDAAEQDLLDKMLAGRGNMWIGLADDIAEGSYRWANGTTLGSYTNWAGTEPDGADAAWEDCVGMAPNGFWYDHDCTANFNYIACESK
jgi:hypothetical protein